MPTAKIDKTYSLPGYTSRSARVVRTADHALVWGGADAPITLNTAHQMTDYAEGAANVVTGNVTAGHGEGDGERLYDFYWQESGVNMTRYGVPTTFATNAITTTNVGAGDDFPTTPDAQPILCLQTEVFTSIDGDEVALFWASLIFGDVLATGRGHVDFQETDNTQVGEINIEGVILGNAIVDYDIEGGVTNPLAGEPIREAEVSHNDTTYTPTFELSVLADSTA
jgi:hypothetical protein